jgi:hypothetical protein
VKNNPYNRLTSLTSSLVPRDQFVCDYAAQHRVDLGHCRQLLRKAIGRKSADELEHAITICTLFRIFSPQFSDLLCEALRADWHVSHEDLAMIMAEIKDPATVACLSEMSTRRFSYLEYDDTFQFARKCIKALSAIDSKEAINGLQMLAKDENGIIAAYALKELNLKGLN